MTEAEALAYIGLYADAETDPVLTAGDLSLLLSLSRRVDQYGLPPGETDWEETYDVYYAVAQAWLVKAGRVANRYMFMTGGKMFSRQQYYDHCMQMYHKNLMKSPIKAYRLSPDQVWLGWVPNNAVNE